MESGQSKLGFISAAIGLLNPIVCFVLLLRVDAPFQILLIFVIPLIGILFGISAVIQRGTGRATGIIGIILNLLPSLGIAALLLILKNSEGNFGTFR